MMLSVKFKLRPGFMLPPLMFSQSELEALVLGARWVTKFTDASMTESAENALAKISDVLPQELRQELEHNTLLVGPRVFKSTETVDLGVIRQSIRQQQKLHIIYLDTKKRTTTRIIWPFALGYFEDTRIVAGWCETRHDFRHFCTDRIHQATMMIYRYPRHRSALLKEWRSLQYQDDV